MTENPLQETRFEMPVRVANLMRGSEERLCLEEGVERRWKTWFLCEMATIRVGHLVIVCFFEPYYTGQAVQQATQWSSSSRHCVACCLAWPV